MADRITQTNVNESRDIRTGQVATEVVEVDVTTEVVEWDLAAKLRAKLGTKEDRDGLFTALAAAIDDLAGVPATGTDPEIPGLLDDLTALIADAIARKDAADLVLADPTARNAKKNAATQARVDALQDRDRARADKQLAGVVLFLVRRVRDQERAINALLRLVLRADLLDDNAGT